MTPQELRRRTFEFALQTYRFAKPLLRNVETRHVGTQIIRAGTSVAANYRAAGQGRSRREFCAKLGTVREEADEALFWLEFIHAAEPAIAGNPRLTKEAHELTAIFSAAYRTAKQRLKKAQRVSRTVAKPDVA